MAASRPTPPAAPATSSALRHTPPRELVLGGLPRPASDLWSLGTVLFDAVQGRPPFLDEGLVPTLTAVLHDPQPPASRASRLRPLVEQLLVKDPAARPSSAAIRSMLVEAYRAACGTVTLNSSA